jgi:8-oxo-dGTP pyrophosphatase MutT (NUDIX family)
MLDQERKALLFDLIRRRVPLRADGHELASILADAQLNPDWREGTDAASHRRASVLIPIVDRDPEPSILLTKRTEHLAAHPGQISFPGGGHEAGDRNDLATALREAREEVGIGSDLIDIIGQLKTYRTVTDFAISPFVGVVRADFELNIDEHEVESVFELPLMYLLDPRHHTIESRIWKGHERFFYAIPYEGYYIWGATAAMLVNLYHALLHHAEKD